MAPYAYNPSASTGASAAPTGGLKAVLHRGTEGGAIVIQGDSTGNGADEWFYLLAQALAAAYPAYSFRHRLWNDTTQSYDPYTSMQDGTAGDAYLLLTGTGYVSTPHKAAYNITDLDVRAKVMPDAWVTPGINRCLVNKLGAAGARAWEFYLQSSGLLTLQYSLDGTNLVTTNSTAIVPFSAGQAGWVRVTRAGATGTFAYYTSTDGVTWAQLGNTVASTAGAIFANTNQIEVGLRGGSAEPFSGRFYYAEMRASIGGKLLFSMDLDPYPPASFGDGEGNTWTLAGTGYSKGGSPGLLCFNGSTPGQVLSYSADSTRFALQVPIDPLIAFVNYGHNEAAANWMPALSAFVEQLRARNAPVVVCAQNPQTAPRTALQIETHAAHTRQALQVAAMKGLGVVNAFDVINDAGSPATYVLDTDGVHPSTAGSALWAAQARKVLGV